MTQYYGTYFKPRAGPVLWKTVNCEDMKLFPTREGSMLTKASEWLPGTGTKEPR
ncbi:hypothetical protein SCLCIDRAFT_1221520 [Scleroderma citrinum Foug A]|uniref:Uncharacterized protein n=1 Tax=Scleroderma citrinum Foug A TaxID=1036808 RepID=A0A0C3D252_9AGAM|nr:hypothetical protein SCLCIDRAFT_1221520 [Scleroderma citrinum Foug A]